MKVIAEFVDIRNGKRYLPGDGAKIDPPLDDDQVHRLTKAECLAEGEEAAAGGLRQDGPTIGEFIAAGYKASSYPPHGYAARSTAEEIAAAVEAEAPGAAIDGMTVVEPRQYAEQRGIDLGDATKKADIIAAINLAVEGR